MLRVSHTLLSDLLCMNCKSPVSTMFSLSGKLESSAVTHNTPKNLHDYSRPPLRTASWTLGFEGQYFPFMGAEEQFSTEATLVHHGARTMSDTSVCTLPIIRNDGTISKPCKEVRAIFEMPQKGWLIVFRSKTEEERKTGQLNELIEIEKNPCDKSSRWKSSNGKTGTKLYANPTNSKLKSSNASRSRPKGFTNVCQPSRTPSLLRSLIHASLIYSPM